MLYHTNYSAIYIRDDVINISDISWYFFKAKEIWFLMQTIDMKNVADKLNMHKYLS